MPPGIGPDIRRREWLMACAGGLVAGLAGCLDRGDDADVMQFRFPHPPETIQFNPWGSRFAEWADPLVFGFRSVSQPGGEPRLEYHITDVEIDNDEATVHYADGYQWWNGDPVTARDDWLAYQIDSFMGVPTRIESVEYVDEHTLTVTFDRAVNERLLRRDLASGFIRTPRAEYEEWYERFTDTTEDGRTEVAEELQEWWLPLEEIVDDGLGSSPYRVTEVLESRVVAEPFSDHPSAENLPAEEFVLPVAERDRADQLLVQGDFDVGSGRLANLEGAVPDEIEQLVSNPSDSGIKLLCHWGTDHLGHRGVRRAIVAALPLEDMVQPEWTHPVTVQTGLHPPSVERWLVDDGEDELLTEPIESDPDRAEELLEEAGYSRSGNEFIHDERGTLSISLRYPSWPRWALIADFVQDSLEAIGIEVTGIVQEPTTFTESVRSQTFELALWWDEGDPLTTFDVTRSDPSALGIGVDDSQADTGRHGKPVVVDIPDEPGARSRTETNLVELWRTIESPPDPETEREAIRTFVRWWNHDLPDIQLLTADAGLWGNTNRFDWPAEEDDRYRYRGQSGPGYLYLLTTGAVEPNETD